MTPSRASLLLLGIAVLVWPHPAAMAAEPLRLGVLLPNPTNQALVVRRAAELAAAHANLQPGPPVQLVFRGRPGQWGTEGEEAGALALDAAADLILAPPDGAASHQVMQVAGRTRIPVISLCHDGSITRAGIPWVLRFGPATEDQALAIFSALTNSPQPVRTWTAFVPEQRAGREAAADLSSAATRVGVRLQAPTRLPPDIRQWRKLVDQTLANTPQGILLWLEPETAGKLATRLRQAGFTSVLAGPMELQSREFCQAAGKAAEGLLAASMGVSPEDRQWNEFSQAHLKQFGEAPDITAAIAFDAARLAIIMLRTSGESPLFRSMPPKRQFSGMFGPLSFDPNGAMQSPITLRICRGEQFQTLSPSPLQAACIPLAN